MTDDLIGKWELSRRRVLGTAAGLGLAGPSGAALSVERPLSVAPKAGRPPQLRRLTYGDIYADRQAVWKPIGASRSIDDLLVQRSPDQAHHHVRRRREDRRLPVLAVLLPQLRQPGTGRTDRPAGRRRLSRISRRSPSRSHHQEDHGLPYFSAVWVWNYYADMLEKLHRQTATYDESSSIASKPEGRRVALSILWIAGVDSSGCRAPGTR